MHRSARLAALALAAFAVAGKARAANCTITAVPAANFGLYSPVATTTPVVTLGAVTYKCTGVNANNNMAVVKLSGSSGARGNAPRSMLGPGQAPLNYNIYLDASATQVFGDGTNGTVPVPSPINGNSRDINLYGNIFPGQMVPVGSYTDQLTVTFEF